jgi:hypothetical protein
VVLGFAPSFSIGYLLSGYIRCICGSGFEALSRPSGRLRAYVYGCAAHKRKGDTVCANGLLMPMEAADAAVLASIEDSVFKPKIVAHIIERTIGQMDCDQVAQKLDLLERELREVKAAFGNLLQLAETGASDVSALVSRLREKEGRQRALEAEITALVRQRQAFDRDKTRRWIEDRLTDWHRLFRNNRQQSRQVIQALLTPLPGATDRRLEFTPDGNRYTFRGAATPERILSGVVGTWWRPQGVLHEWAR